MPTELLLSILNNDHLIKRSDLQSQSFIIYGIIKNWITKFVQTREKYNSSKDRIEDDIINILVQLLGSEFVVSQFWTKD